MTQILLSIAFASESPVLPPETLARVEAFRAAERALELHEGHESVIRLHVDADGRPVRTPRAALIISGLFNSPLGMKRLEEYFVARGENVVNLRLIGHYERDVAAIARTVTWSEWREQSAAAFALARALGDRVTVVGHSTGGLLGTWLAVDHPRDVAALALFAPAFGLSKGLRAVLALPTDVTLKVKPVWRPFDPPRVMTLHAGREVERLGHEFANHVGSESDADFAKVAARLADTPVWMANTGFDRVIDLGATARFGQALNEAANAARRFEKVHLCHLLLHDHLAAGEHRHWRRFVDSLDRTLESD